MAIEEPIPNPEWRWLHGFEDLYYNFYREFLKDGKLKMELWCLLA